MKRFVTIVLFVVLAAAVFRAASWLAGYGGATVFQLFIDLDPLTKLGCILLMLGLQVVLLLGVVQLFARTAALAAFLRAALWIAPLLGLACAALGGLAVLQASAATHVTRLDVLAPGLAEALIPLALGLQVGAAAAILDGLAAALGRTPAPAKA
jgi:hypothetical protein